jgi:hypothetical protein
MLSQLLTNGTYSSNDYYKFGLAVAGQGGSGCVLVTL